MSNHIKDLLAEWYEYQGYFVRRNVKVGKRDAGGYECELDIVAFHPITKQIIHLELSLDADPWEKRKLRYAKKFTAGKRYISEILHGVYQNQPIEQIAIFVLDKNTNHAEIGGGKIINAEDIVNEIVSEIRTTRLAKNAIPEEFPLLRTIQYVFEFQKTKTRIIKASIADGKILSAIAYSSTRYLNYPEERFLAWKEDLTITKEYLRTNIVRKLMLCNDTIGFYSIQLNETEQTIKSIRIEKGFWLDHFFIKPEYIGFHFGKMMFIDCSSYCRKNDIKEIKVFVDPKSEGFYQKMGCKKVRMSKSSITGREIPVYKIDI